jgi:hypothetical protein
MNDTRSWDFTYIRTNVYVGRRKRALHCDQAAVCSCPQIDGEPGCPPGQCLNRMTNVECCPRLCPTGETCSNQRFQRREYAAVAPFKTARKGWGLIALEDLVPGQFVMEYVGEVISACEMQRRLTEQVVPGEPVQGCHMYFLTLTGEESIDASHKGNLARFINHSCEPNCQTVKWQVLGEMCVGIFAKEHVRAGTELTFDYHMQRFGAFKQHCYCGAPTCRKWLGEPPSPPPSKTITTAATATAAPSRSKSKPSPPPPKDDEDEEQQEQ